MINVVKSTDDSDATPLVRTRTMFVLYVVCDCNDVCMREDVQIYRLQRDICLSKCSILIRTENDERIQSSRNALMMC